jgi:hypothetical protein
MPVTAVYFPPKPHINRHSQGSAFPQNFTDNRIFSCSKNVENTTGIVNKFFPSEIFA